MTSSEIACDPRHPDHGRILAHIRALTKHVRLRLAAGAYNKTLDVQVVSDTLESGWYLMENAIHGACERLPSRDVPADPSNPAAGMVRIAFVELTDAAGDRRIVEDADLRGVEWLKDFIVSAEIVE